MDSQEGDTVCGVLREMGFNYNKKDGKQFIYKRADILEQRHTYLQHILKHRRENKTVIYMDETWVNAHHTNQYIWVDSDGKGGWKLPSGKGQRLIIVHAGGAEGWVTRCRLGVQIQDQFS